jgi:hypothetical protein
MLESMFRGSRAPRGRSEDRCDRAGSEADGAKHPIKPGHKLPTLGVWVFPDESPLVNPPSSGLGTINLEERMRLTLALTPQEEAKLLAKAQSQGTTPEGLVKEAIQPILDSVPECLPPGKLAGAEKAAAFRAWAKSFPPDLPMLSLADVSRENLYHWD